MAKNETDEDRGTVERVLNGDFNAFERLVEKYQGRIYRHLRKLVKDGHVAEDLLQETFLNSYKGLSRFSGASAFSTWLFRIATNNALMHLRRVRPESLEYDDEIANPSHFDPAPASPQLVRTPLQLLISQEGQRKIEGALEQLPVVYRTVLMLRDVEGFSLKEVSEIMSSTVPAVKSRLHRARHSMRAALGTYYAEMNGARREKLA